MTLRAAAVIRSVRVQRKNMTAVSAAKRDRYQLHTKHRARRRCVCCQPVKIVLHPFRLIALHHAYPQIDPVYAVKLLFSQLRKRQI